MEKLEVNPIVKNINQNYLQLFDYIDSLLFILDENWNIVSVNNPVIWQLGYSIEELQHQNILFIYPLNKHQELSNIQKEIYNETRNTYSLPIISKEGTLFLIETTVIKGIHHNKDVLFLISKNISENYNDLIPSTPLPNNIYNSFSTGSLTSYPPQLFLRGQDIILITQSPFIKTIISDLLEKQGANVILYRSSIEAFLQILENKNNFKSKVLIIDNGLVNMSGVKFSIALKSINISTKYYIILISNHADKTDLEKNHSNDFDLLLDIPINIDTLKEFIGKVYEDKELSSIFNEINNFNDKPEEPEYLNDNIKLNKKNSSTALESPPNLLPSSIPKTTQEFLALIEDFSKETRLNYNLVMELYTDYLEMYPTHILKINELFNDKSYSECIKELHALKGSTGNIRLLTMFEMMASTEKLLKEGNYEAAKKLLEELVTFSSYWSEITLIK